MKKVIYLIIISLTSLSLKAQLDGLQVGLSGGYSIGVMGNSIETLINYKTEDNTYYSQNMKFTLGQAPYFMVNIDYLYKNMIGLSFAYKYNFNSQIVFNKVSSIAGVDKNEETIISSKRSSFIPALRLNTDFEKINAFIKIGPSFNSIKQEKKETITVKNKNTEYFWRYAGKSGMGFYGEIGVIYDFTKNISASINVSFEAYNYSPEFNHLVSMKQNDSLQNIKKLLPIEKEVEFQEWLPGQYAQNPDPKKPLQLPRQTFIYNNIGFMLGVFYNF